MNHNYNKYKYFLEKSITNQYGGTNDINQEWYNMDVHYGMLRDYNRMTCYYKFIRQNKWLKNKICCDIGSGTGILSLLSTITYYCSDIKGIFGDSGKYNTNWRKQLILFRPIKINPGDIITCIIRMKNLKKSTIEQQINIKLYKNNNKFYSNKFRSLYDNKWLYNFDPVGLYFPNNALSKMKEMTNN